MAAVNHNKPMYLQLIRSEQVASVALGSWSVLLVKPRRRSKLVGMDGYSAQGMSNLEYHVRVVVGM